MPTRRACFVASILALVLLAFTTAHAEWRLYQNEPNPFCNAPGETVIRFLIDVESDVLLQVWNADFSELVRVPVNGRMVPGMHSLLWNGEDENGRVLAAGLYPYRLEARDPDLGLILFEDTRISRIDCATPAIEHTWGRIKSRYR